jgi:hypothetical protein
MKDCCKKNMVWVEKHSDLTVPTADGLDIEYVDINFFRCKVCGYVRADAD